MFSRQGSSGFCSSFFFYKKCLQNEENAINKDSEYRGIGFIVLILITHAGLAELGFKLSLQCFFYEMTACGGLTGKGYKNMTLPTFTLRQMIEAGVHFGHHARRWNPKMAPFIYGKKDNIHIIDLQKTYPMLYTALNAASEIAAQ